jgi:hypothetical protein
MTDSEKSAQDSARLEYHRSVLGPLHAEWRAADGALCEFLSHPPKRPWDTAAYVAVYERRERASTNIIVAVETMLKSTGGL